MPCVVFPEMKMLKVYDIKD